MMPMTDLETEISLRVRYAETDAMGIVHHANYLLYFEEGRSAFIRERRGSYADFERAGYSLAVASVAVRYLQPARYDDLLIVRTQLVSSRSRSVEFAYEVVRTADSSRCVLGTTMHICLDQEGKVVRIPTSWRL